MRDRSEVAEQLSMLEKMLNDGWNIIQTVALSAASGMAAPNVMQMGSPGETQQFAEWASVLVLERAR